jgi:hypothetical protein
MTNGSDKEWGPKVSTRGAKDLFAPHKVRPRTVPPPGIDNLHLSSQDTFELPGRGEVVAEFKGFFRVARAAGTTKDWATAEVHVNMVDIYLEGEADGVGPIIVRANRDRVSPGQTFGAGQQGVQKCRIAAAVTFEAPELGVTLFNKEPVLLMNDAIDSIPPVEDPNGAAYIYRLPLFDTSKEDGKPFGYLTQLRYTVGNYVTQAEGKRFHQLARQGG